MYIAKQFEEQKIDVMHELIRAYPLSTLVTYSSNGLNANHIPLHLSAAPEPYGTLTGHIARANPLFAEIAEGPAEALIIFHGPTSYITPSWYATKKETGKAVPTWNYAAVHAYGILHVVENAEWLREQIDALTIHNEASFPHPWAVSDAPADYTEKLMTTIVGIKIVITKILGKWKVSQNQPAQNQAGVILGLNSRELPESRAMATLVEVRAKNTR